jgi:hypothetical protein
MITLSDLKIEGKIRVKTEEKYPNTPVITKLEIEDGQRSASIHFNSKSQEILNIELPSTVVIIEHNNTFLVTPFDIVKQNNEQLANAFESKKMVYRLGMNGKVSSKTLYNQLKLEEYELVVENPEERIFKLVSLDNNLVTKTKEVYDEF